MELQAVGQLLLRDAFADLTPEPIEGGLGHRDRFDDIPFFWSAHYDAVTIGYTGHVERWDATVVEGDVDKLDCAVSYLVGGKRRAMATINRDRQNLETEVELARQLLMEPPPPVSVEAQEV